MTFQEFDHRIRILFAQRAQWDIEEIPQEQVVELSLDGEYCTHFLQFDLEELYEKEEKIGWEPLAAAIGGEMDAAVKAQRRNRSLGYPNDLSDEQKELFERLRARRAAIAREKHVPPYVIFSNRTLYEMCVRRPEDGEAMRALYGVGEINFARYGEEFLRVIRGK